MSSCVRMVLAFSTSMPSAKVSSSVGDFACNTVAAELFNGGGHRNASGGESHLSLDETRQLFVQSLPKYFKK